MHIILNHSSMVPIYEQLMEQIKSEIINTALKEGEALPSVRSLAGELRISALTVKKAYDKLEEEGMQVNRLTEEDKAAFKEALAPMYEKYKGEFGEDVFTMAEKYEQ